MQWRWALCFLLSFLFGGCAGVFQLKHAPLYDLSVGTTYPGGVCATLLSRPEKPFGLIGCIGDTSGRTWVASRAPLPESLYVGWRNNDHEDHLVGIPMRTILPPLEYRQKYHITVLIHRGDSVSTEIRVLDREDCSHLFARSTAYSGPGPCAY